MEWLKSLTYVFIELTLNDVSRKTNPTTIVLWNMCECWQRFTVMGSGMSDRIRSSKIHLKYTFPHNIIQYTPFRKFSIYIYTYLSINVIQTYLPYVNQYSYYFSNKCQLCYNFNNNIF